VPKSLKFFNIHHLFCNLDGVEPPGNLMSYAIVIENHVIVIWAVLIDFSPYCAW
jgi:hypothetical protein